MGHAPGRYNAAGVLLLRSLYPMPPLDRQQKDPSPDGYTARRGVVAEQPRRGRIEGEVAAPGLEPDLSAYETDQTTWPCQPLRARPIINTEIN